MLELIHASFAEVSELFSAKAEGFELEQFPGYTSDQWGIKAHNRPWVEKYGNFKSGQKVLEIGGGYSLFPKYLVDKYRLEAWIADDFGKRSEEPLWNRWGDPDILPKKYPNVRYIFERFGSYSSNLPDSYFDRIFTISTLEHIPIGQRMDVFKDMHRCLKPGGRQLHTIDLQLPTIREALFQAAGDKVALLRSIFKGAKSELFTWINIIENSGVILKASLPNTIKLLDRGILVESPDVVYRFYPPNFSPKPYHPSASLLLIIEKGTGGDRPKSGGFER